MKIELNFINTTDIVAWWGAIIATFVLTWDIYKWKTSGPKIYFRTRSNQKAINIPSREGKTWIFITAENNGNRPTTITTVGMRYYKNSILKFFGKVIQSFVIPGAEATPNQAIPYVLNPGCIWQGLILQTEEVENFAKNGLLICELYCSHKTKAIKTKIKIKKAALSG